MPIRRVTLVDDVASRSALAYTIPRVLSRLMPIFGIARRASLCPLERAFRRDYPVRAHVRLSSGPSHCRELALSLGAVHFAVLLYSSFVSFRCYIVVADILRAKCIVLLLLVVKIRSYRTFRILYKKNVNNISHWDDFEDNFNYTRNFEKINFGKGNLTPNVQKSSGRIFQFC